MAKNSARILLATATTLALLTGATSAVLAQPVDTVNDRVVASDRDSGFDLGWLGLIGLAGLAGLKRRETDPAITTHPVR